MAMFTSFQRHLFLTVSVTVLTASAIAHGDCEWRYLKHYKAKGCTPVFNNTSDDCPVRFICPDIEIDPTVCKLKGKTFALGDPVETSNNCEICNCRQDVFHPGATIDCIGIECPYSMGLPVKKGCYLAYNPGQCCSSPRCPTQNSSPIMCNYNNKTYSEDQKIYPKEDPCLICRCDENWTGEVNNKSCSIFECDIEQEIYNLKKGCVPIYHEKTCCPLEYHCPQNEVQPQSDLNSCYFDNQSYHIGELLDIKHATNCVSCECHTPPDFTCVHHSCPGPPNNDYVNCQSVFNPGQCCAEYNCTQPEISTVMSTNCVAPVCEAGCEIDSVEEGCPGCKCINQTHIRQTRETRCTIPKCGSDCTLVAGDNDECPTCKCGLCIPPKCICSTPRCDEGCVLHQNVSFGECPTCQCKNSGRTSASCSIPPCNSANCKLVSGTDGCLKCTCGSLCVPPTCFCSRPECSEGCEIDTDVPEGRCPGCICKAIPQQHRVTFRPRCPAVDDCVESNCKVVYQSGECPHCECQPVCVTPKCNLPCRLDYNPSNGGCPVCVCKFEPNRGESVQQGYSLQRSTRRPHTRKVCPDVRCPLCDTTLGDDGCIVCLCSKDEEPTPENCKNNVNCQGIQCKLVPDGRGCQKCSCESPCPPLTCERSCSKVENPGTGKCPHCVCQFKPDLE